MKRIFISLALLTAFALGTAEKIVPILEDGGQAPTFMLPSLDDKRISLRDFCGQTRTPWKNTKRYIVIVSFMASYCVPCRHEIPQVEAYAKTAEDDVKILFVSVDTINKEQLLPFQQQLNIQQTVLLDRYGSIMKKYGVQKLPSLFIIDKDGNVRYQNLNGLPPDTDVGAMLKTEVARVRSTAVAARPAAPGAPASTVAPDKKITVLRGLLAGKSQDDLLKESGLSPDDLHAVRAEIEALAKEKWGVE